MAKSINTRQSFEKDYDREQAKFNQPPGGFYNNDPDDPEEGSEAYRIANNQPVRGFSDVPGYYKSEPTDKQLAINAMAEEPVWPGRDDIIQEPIPAGLGKKKGEVSGERATKKTSIPKQPPASVMFKPTMEDLKSRDAFGAFIVKKMGYDAYALDPNAEVEMAQETELPGVFERTFGGKILWRDRENLTKEQQDHWDSVHKAFNVHVRDSATKKKEAGIKEVNHRMKMFDDKVTEKKRLPALMTTSLESVFISVDEFGEKSGSVPAGVQAHANRVAEQLINAGSTLYDAIDQVTNSLKSKPTAEAEPEQKTKGMLQWLKEKWGGVVTDPQQAALEVKFAKIRKMVKANPTPENNARGRQMMIDAKIKARQKAGGQAGAPAQQPAPAAQPAPAGQPAPAPVTAAQPAVQSDKSLAVNALAGVGEVEGAPPSQPPAALATAPGSLEAQVAGAASLEADLSAADAPGGTDWSKGKVKEAIAQGEEGVSAEAKYKKDMDAYREAFKAHNIAVNKAATQSKMVELEKNKPIPPKPIDIPVEEAIDVHTALDYSVEDIKSVLGEEGLKKLQYGLSATDKYKKAHPPSKSKPGKKAGMDKESLKKLEYGVSATDEYKKAYPTSKSKKRLDKVKKVLSPKSKGIYDSLAQMEKDGKLKKYGLDEIVFSALEKSGVLKDGVTFKDFEGGAIMSEDDFNAMEAKGKGYIKKMLKSAFKKGDTKLQTSSISSNPKARSELQKFFRELGLVNWFEKNMSRLKKDSGRSFSGERKSTAPVAVTGLRG